MDNDAVERDLIRRGLAVVVRDAPAAPPFPALSSPSTRQSGKRAAWVVATGAAITLVTVGLALGVGRWNRAPSGPNSVVSQIDAIDPSCESLPDAAQLADVFTTRGSWWKVAAADLVALEVERRTEPQPLVVVDGLEEVATFVGSEDPDGSERRPIEIRQDSFAILELAATEPGDVYLFVHRIGDGRVGGTKPVWVDASGDVHFVGTCASTLWTPTFRNFAGHENWEGTQEELLVALILGGPERDALNEWTFGS